MRPCVLALVAWCAIAPLATPAELPDIPAEPAQDAVMAPPEELAQMGDWASLAFLNQWPPGRKPPVVVQCRRQDHSVLRFGQSCMETPLRIGTRQYPHGLGTHANSVIAVELPPKAKLFRAWVGIDNNEDTQGRFGSAVFSAEINGKEVFRSPVCKGGEEARPVEVPLPPGTGELILKVDTTADGPSHDQANWADAQVVLEDGRVVWLDEGQPSGLIGPAIPFSFRYGQADSATLLAQWPRTVRTTEAPDGRRHEVTWTDPATGLAVEAAVRVFRQFPAVEWVVYFENRGQKDTPILADIQALDVQLRTGWVRRPAQLHGLVGDVCGERSFLPQTSLLEPGRPLVLSPAGGRPSNGAFPFFNVQYGQEGVIVAIGWSGQWAASLARAETGPTRLRAGMERTHLRLHPGERIRTPRIVLLPWKGDRLAAHNRWRRLMLFHYVPRVEGRPLRLPIALQCFDRYSWTRPEWATEAGQFAAVRAAAALGCDTYWLDAAWFEGGFPNGVGNWTVKPKEFPRGLKPMSDACHALGLKFVLWFEPERVAPGTRIAREHPQFVFGPQGGLFRLDDPAARAFLADLLGKCIAEFGIDVYRNDFNIDPLEYWRRNDPPDRQGITEIRYVEGHYALWDKLLAGRPGLWIDNCASGGRRIDLETCSRSVPLWRSDTSCSPGHAEWDQTQTLGLSLYVPLFTACAWSPEAYVLRSAATGGAICQFDYLDPKFPVEKAKAALAEIRENQKYWYGDFYPLTPATTEAEHWAAWQLHRPDLQAGIVLAFRRSRCPYPALMVGLHAVEPQATYAVQWIGEDRTVVAETRTGRQLAEDLELHLPQRGTSLLLRYRRLGP